jgi:hypothetical protein
MDSGIPEKPISIITQQTPQQNYQQPNKSHTKKKVYKILLIFITILFAIFILPFLFFIFAFGKIDNPLADWQTVKKIESMKSQMDKICEMYGYYPIEEFSKLDFSYPESVTITRNPIAADCLDKVFNSHVWPNRCQNLYFEYILDNNYIKGPGEMHAKLENDFGDNRYHYKYHIQCKNEKSNYDISANWPIYNGNNLSFKYNPDWGIISEDLGDDSLSDSLKIIMPNKNYTILGFMKDDYMTVSEIYNRLQNRSSISIEDYNIDGRKGIKRLSASSNPSTSKYHLLYSVEWRNNNEYFFVETYFYTIDYDLLDQMEGFAQSIEFN